MAAITPVTTPVGTLLLLRDATAQANTGQTDWIPVPSWARSFICSFNLTAVAGTSPLADITLVTLPIGSWDDTYVHNLQDHTAFTQITAAAHLEIQVGPGDTGAANDVTTAGTGYSHAHLNGSLPPLLGVKCLFDRTSANETYTYTLAIAFRG